nr:proline-rich receptor-like protein kinase PERK9 [Aegilops tauschii subsp. strangulata]
MLGRYNCRENFNNNGIRTAAPALPRPDPQHATPKYPASSRSPATAARNLASSRTARPPPRSTTARQRSSPAPTAGVAPHQRSSSTAAHPNPPSTGPQAAAAPNYPPPAEALQPANHCRRRPPSRAADTPPLRCPNNHCILLPSSPHSRAAPPSTPSATIVIAKPHHRRTPSSMEGLRRSNYVLRSCTSSPSRLHRASSDGSASSTSPRSTADHVLALLSSEQLCLLNILSLDIAASCTSLDRKKNGKRKRRRQC